jgi:hypothetical protein
MALAGALTAVVATVVLTPPVSVPVSVAAESQGINIEQVALNAPKNLPNFDDTYQRHMGVLDVLKVPSP